MGRSVMVHCRSIDTVYVTLEDGAYCEHCRMLTYYNDGTCNECDQSIDFDTSGDWERGHFDDIVETLRAELSAKYPSMRNCDYWEYRECRAIVENDLCAVFISEYCNLVAIDVVPNDKNPFGGHWAASNAVPAIRELFPDRLERIGTFSNGESVYQRIGEQSA